MVNGDRFLDGLWLCHRALPLGGVQRRFDQGRNAGESETATDEFAHRNLVRRIEHGRCGSARRERPPRKRERREAYRIGFLEGERGDTGKIEPRRRCSHAYRPRQTVGNRNPHIRRPELSDDRAVAELDQAMDDGLRMNDHVECIGC